MLKRHVYLQEAATQVEFAKRSFAAYEQARNHNDIPSIFLNLHHFVVHAGNLDKLLNPKPDSPRAKILDGAIDVSRVDLKLLRRLRNHLEHFDERLDQWVAKYAGQAFLDMNIITGAAGFPAESSLRALDGSTFKFHGESYDLDALFTEVLKLGEAIEKATGTN